jgi:hypothetical protein
VPPKGSVAQSFFASDFVRRAMPSCAQVSAFPSRNFDLSSSAASVCRSGLIWAHRQGPRAKASCECHLSDRVGALSDRHLAQPSLCPIVPGLCLIVTWLSQVSVRSSLGSARPLSDRVRSLSDPHLAQPDLCPIVPGLCLIVTWLSQVSVRSCRVSVRSSLGSARPLSDRVGSLSDRHLAQPDLCPIVIWLSLVFVRSCWVSIRSSFCSASFFVWCVASPIHSVICYSGRVLSLISKVVFLAPFQVSGVVPNTVPRADS